MDSNNNNDDNDSLSSSPSSSVVVPPTPQEEEEEEVLLSRGGSTGTETAGNRTTSMTTTTTTTERDEILQENEDSDNENVPRTPQRQSQSQSQSRTSLLTPLSNLNDNNNDNESTFTHTISPTGAAGAGDGGTGTGESTGDVIMNDVDDEIDEDDNDDDDDDNEEKFIRGTDVHVPTAAKTFTNFLRTFRSLNYSNNNKDNNKKNKKKDNNNDNDDDDDNSSTSSSSTTSSSDNDEENIPPLYYITKLKELIHTGSSSTTTIVDDGEDHHEHDERQDETTTITDNNNIMKSLDINTMHIYYHNIECQKFYYQLISYPMEIIPLMDLIVSNEYDRLINEEILLIEEKINNNNDNDNESIDNNENEQQHGDQLMITLQNLQNIQNNSNSNNNNNNIQVRPYNLKDISSLRNLDPIHVDHLLSIQGMIVRTSQIIPDLKVGHFQCIICGNTTRVTIDRGIIREPNVCMNCNIRNSYNIIHNRNIYANKQMVRIQETPEEVPPGLTPASVTSFAYDDLVDTIKPGDRIEITGVLRAQPKRLSPKTTKVNTVYKTFIDIIHFRRIMNGNNNNNNNNKDDDDDDDTNDQTKSKTKTKRNDNRLVNNNRTDMNIKFSNERIVELYKLSQSSDIYSKLTNSLAPSIYGLDDCKKGILALMFGGNSIRIKCGSGIKKQQKFINKMNKLINNNNSNNEDNNEKKKKKTKTKKKNNDNDDGNDSDEDSIDALLSGSGSGSSSSRRRSGDGKRRNEKQQKVDNDDDDMDEDEDDDTEEAHDDDDDDDNDNGTETESTTTTTTTTTRKLNKRGDINILMCGDPGTSKSQLLSFVNKLSCRGVYTSGKGSSAVGLTAAVVRDPETKELILESGALVLSDLGICCIDEFDKMSDATRSVLHEAMEQQTVSIAKSGIIATLNARTSVLASANPIESRYNPSRSVVENIQLPPTLLSRFDLIYLILDSPNVDSDRRLAQHLVGLYYETPNVIQPPLDTDILRDYIDYAREYIHPEISDDATNELISGYLHMRNMGGGSSSSSGKKSISATPRQLESLIRLSEAIAKMRYSFIVTKKDVKEAIRLMKVATQAAATDPRTGRIDMDMITTGKSYQQREQEELVLTNLKELLLDRKGSNIKINDIVKQLNEIMLSTTTTSGTGHSGGVVDSASAGTVSQDSVIAALRTMDGDGIIQLSERAQTVHVRH